MQQQAPERMTQPRSFQQCLPQGQTNITKGPMKRQVAEAWKNVKSNEGDGSKMLGSQYQCQCCMHYGFPCLQNKPNKRKVQVNPNCEDNVDKKRKKNSPDPVLVNDQHLGSTTLSHLSLIPSQMNPNYKELEASQAKNTSHEVCIDGWTITCKEFQPQKTKQAKRKCYHYQ